MVEQTVRRLKIGHVRLHGGVPTAKRGELMDRFREDEATQVFISTDAGGTGLNLQAATVLINLDMPWNPAVLDQRIARVHRLGQTNKVQIILMVAVDSYEEQIVRLIKHKRDLFTNVITAEASEDVVGVSKKLLDAIVEDLVETEPKSSEVHTEEPPEPEKAVERRKQIEELEESEEDKAVRHCIEVLQSTFGFRIERILGAGGGLLVVMDPVDAEAEQIAQQLSQVVPVALIDPRTFKGLQRLGTASPVGETNIYYEVEQDKLLGHGSPLLSLAKEKLKAAEVLVEQQCLTGAMDLLSSAMLSATAGKANLSQVPSPEQTSVWLYSEAMPQGIVTADQATVLARALSLSNASQVPANLVYEVLEDTRIMVGQTAG